MVEGYKHTDIGVIPNNWDVHELGSVASYRRGSFPQPYGLPKWYDDNNGMPFVQVFDVDENMMLKPETKQKISDAAKDKSVFVPKGSIVLTIQGSIGRIAITQYDAYVDRTLLIFQSFKKPIDKWFFMYVVYQLFQIEKAKAPGGTIKTITKAELSSFLIPLPPLAEQTAIATVLRDTDALIQKLEQLIAKKRNIKTGAMQELLKPKEGWEVKKLGELARYRRGSFPQPYGLEKWYDDKGGFPFVQVFDVDENLKLKPETKRRISEEAQKMSVFAQKGSIVLTIQGSIGRIAMTQYDAYIDRTLLLFESLLFPFDLYFFMLLVYVLFEQEKQKAPGGTIKTITKETLSSFKVSYPNLEEQTRIAQILSDMENEIQELEKQLEKYKMLKQGMMQVLLTGKIRLI